MPTVDELKELAKKRGLKGYSKLRKAELMALLGMKEHVERKSVIQRVKSAILPKPKKAAFDKKIDKLVNEVITQGYEQYNLTPEAYKCLSIFAKKLALKRTVIPRYLGEAAAEYVGVGLFPNKVEYVLRELLDLSVNATRDKGTSLITKETIERVAKNDEDINEIFF